MTAHCTHKSLFALSLLAAAFIAGAPVVSAQTRGAPIQLLPPPRPHEEAVPPPQADPEGPAGVSSETVIGGIRIDDLAPPAPETDSIGTVDGLGPDLWRGTSRILIESYLPRLPAPVSSPVARHLARELLLSSGTVPPAPAGSAVQSVTASRFGRLTAMGDVDDFSALARALPASRDEASLRARVEADFLTGDEGSACAEVSAPDRLASFRGEFWNRATTVCDAVGGRTAQAQLALDLMGEQGVPADSPFAVLLRSALGDRATLTNLSGVGAVELPLLRLSKAEVAATALPSASVLALRTIALGKGALPIRLEAAERAEALGGISTANLAEIYASVPFKNDEISNALTAASSDSSARGWALLYKAEEAQQVQAAKAEVIKAAVSAARVSSRDQGRLAQVQRVYAKAVAGIDPAPELAWFAGDAARVLYATGDQARAEEWRGLLGRDPDNAAAFAGLWPLAAIASAPAGMALTVADAAGAAAGPTQAGRFDATGFKAWLASLGAAERAAKGAVALTLLDSLGVAIPPEAWAPYLDAAGPGGSSPLLAPLSRAAESGRSGETVLLGLVTLGAGDAHQWPSSTVAAVATALTRVHLGADARALALEAAFAAGL